MRMRDWAVAFWGLGLGCVLSAGCSPPEPEQVDTDHASGFVSLFDGRSLEGWRKAGGAATYRVEDGTIVGDAGKDLAENTFLRTEKTFSDFVLKLQVKLEVPCNSGVQFRSQQSDEGRIFGYQFEVDPSQRAWSGGVYDESRRGWLAPPGEGREVALREGAWNDVLIEAIGPRLRTWLNGVAVSDLLDPYDQEGFIALQVHAGPEGVLRWRDIQIKELGEPKEWTGVFDGESLGGWETEDRDSWRVRNHTLIGQSGSAPGEPLVLRRDLGDFLLRMEYSGVSGSPALVLRRDRDRGAGGIAASLAASDQAGQWVAADRAEVFAEARPPDPAAPPPPEWRELTVAAIGQRFVSWIDGRMAADVEVGEALPGGRLALAVAAADSGIRVRSVELMALGDAAEDLPEVFSKVKAPPAPVLAPDQALESFRIAPGFRVELVASEPLVVDPVAFDWDDRGRLFVAEMRGYMHDLEGAGEDSPSGQVVILEDDDGDGVMDRSTVFADGLTMPRAVRVVPQGVLIAAPPDLLLCRDEDGDSVCDEKLRLIEYGVEGSNVEHLENGLLPALDNWIYSAKSDRRLQFRDGELVSEPTVMRGQWGIEQDRFGRLYYVTNSSFVLADFFPAEYFTSVVDLGPQPGLSEDISDNLTHAVRVNFGANRAYLEGSLRPDGRQETATSAGGIAINRSNYFGADADGDAFVGESAVNAIARFGLPIVGAGVTARHRIYDDPDWGKREFLASTDERFRPVFLSFGPDGALYVADMYRGVIQHAQFLSDYLKGYIVRQRLVEPIGLGRIYRIVREDRAPVRPQLDLAEATAEQLVTALSSPLAWQRDRAQQRLVAERPQAAVTLLRDWQRHSSTGRVHAVWALAGMAALDRATWAAAMADEEPAVRVAALKAGESVIDGEAFSNAAFAGLEDPDLTVRMQAMLSASVRAGGSDDLSGYLAAIAERVEAAELRRAAVANLVNDAAAVLDGIAAAPGWQSASPGRIAFIQLLVESAIGVQRLRAAGGPSQPALALLATLSERRGKAAWRDEAAVAGLVRVAGGAGERIELAERPALLSEESLAGEGAVGEGLRNARLVFTWPGDDSLPGVVPLSPEQKERMKAGGELYAAACAACHGADGKGQSGVAPTLVASPWVLDSVDWTGRIVLQGLAGPIVVGDTEWDDAMPALDAGDVTNETLAGLFTYMRRSFGNSGYPVEPEEVARVRAQSLGRNTAWTAEELLALPIEHQLDRYLGRYKLPQMPLWLTVSRDGGELKLWATGYGETQLESLGNGRYRATDGKQHADLTFVVDSSGRVEGVELEASGRGKAKFVRAE